MEPLMLVKHAFLITIGFVIFRTLNVCVQPLCPMDGCNSTTSEIDVNTSDISRNSLLNERVPADPTLFIPPSPLIADDPLLKPGGAATMALGVSAVDLTSGKTKTIVIHPPHKHHEGTANQSSLVTLDGHFL
ncbi:uncharacterized protein TNCV_3565461 [Trichonephila clavipes]|nr:uncharacterized protein TNCV_3565461 [Trichonephila clavipes]